MQNFTSTDVAVLALELLPAVALGLAGEHAAKTAQRWPRSLRLCLPIIFALPYILIASLHHMFSWAWLALYACLPPLVAALLTSAAAADPEQHGCWQDALILLALGLGVDCAGSKGRGPPGSLAWASCCSWMLPYMDLLSSGSYGAPALISTSAGAIGKVDCANSSSSRP